MLAGPVSSEPSFLGLQTATICGFVLVRSSLCACALPVSLLFNKDTSHTELEPHPNGLILLYFILFTTPWHVELPGQGLDLNHRWTYTAAVAPDPFNPL